jgi:hypothetical protein
MLSNQSNRLITNKFKILTPLVNHASNKVTMPKCDFKPTVHKVLLKFIY